MYVACHWGFCKEYFYPEQKVKQIILGKITWVTFFHLRNFFPLHLILSRDVWNKPGFDPWMACFLSLLKCPRILYSILKFNELFLWYIVCHFCLKIEFSISPKMSCVISSSCFTCHLFHFYFREIQNDEMLSRYWQ